MFEKPRPTNESLFSKSMMVQCLMMGGSIGLIVFGTWIALVNGFHYDIVVARSLVMTLMVFLQNLHAFNCRSEKTSIFKMSLLTNKFFVVSIVGSIGLQILFMEVPSLSKLLSLTTVPYLTMALIFAVSFIIILTCEIYKAVLRRMDKKTALQKGV
jgi:magnesium-transporting ATPase (P-type)